MNILKAGKETTLASLGAVTETAKALESIARIGRKSIDNVERELDDEWLLKAEIRTEMKPQLKAMMKPKMAQEILESMDLSEDEISAMMATIK